jgi:biopolymer transport protein exbB
LPLNEYLVVHIRNSLAQTMRQFDYGMTALASIGATAPFIGLLGTVWGIYHALIGISESGQMSIAAVAGPIGEALVSTAVGLFVAIPAVLAYNFLNRGTKTIAQDMDAFAHDLHVRLLNQKD